MKISKFKLIDSLGSYDKSKNINRLSIYDLLSEGVSWTYNGKNYQLLNEKKITAILLKGEQEIGIVEAPFNFKENKAYIINGDKSIKWNILKLIKNKFENSFINNNIAVSDLYYIENTLYFSIIINNEDYRFSFDPMNGDIGNLIVSR